MKNQRCCAEVWKGWRYEPCANNSKVERDGKFYCGVHDPVKVAERQARHDRARLAQRKAEAYEATRQLRARKALSLLEATYPDDPISNLERLIAADKEAGE
jgi:uncharacterized Zn finger protein (UPF0148 family)